MNKPIILYLILLVSFAGFSQEVPQSFNLQEAIDYALKNNRTAINATKDIDAAKAQK